MGLDINLLGPFRIAYNTQLLDTIDQPREQSLLAYLLLNKDSAVSRQHLAYVFWPDSTEAQARNNLRQVLHQLRHALPEGGDYIFSDANKLYWRSDSAFQLDVHKFEQALAQADLAERSGDMTALRTELEKALNLYRGDLLLSCYDDWILTERERLHQICSRALERIIYILEDQRDYAAAIPFAQRLIRHDRFYENGYRLLMRLYAVSNERASALLTYHTCVDTLQNELGVEPEPATYEIFQRLRSVQRLPTASSPAPESVSAPPLIGRDSAWAQLQTEWQRVVSGAQRFVLLAGEAGIGKSRLAEELLQWAARQGIATAKSRAYAAEGMLSYGPLLDWLRSEACRTAITLLDRIWISEIARLLPELLTESPDLPAPEPLKEHWQRQRFFQALTRAILGMRQPLLLLLDDLQWCDPETLEWLHYLLRADPQARLLLIGTVRAEDTVSNQPLQAFLFDMHRSSQLAEIVLEPLDAEETARLAGHAAGFELDISMALRLFHETEGNPLFILETLRAGFIASEHKSDAQDKTRAEPTSKIMTSIGLPEKVQAVIAGRLAQLSPPARELANLAATVGRAFSIEVLEQASDANEEYLLNCLDELWQRRIVRVLNENTYDFTHDKLREVAYNEVSLPRRRLLHRRVARALEIVHASDLDPVSGQLAAHFELAGIPKKAIHYYFQAALVAQKVNANQEAIRLLEKALTLLRTLAESHERDAWELDLQSALGVSLIDTIGHGATEVIQVYEQALRICQRLDYPPTPPILRSMALNHIVRAEFIQALGYAEQLHGLAERQEDRLLIVEANYAMGVTQFWLGAFQQSREYLEKAIALYDPQDSHAHRSLYSNDPKVICLSRLAFSLWLLGFPDQAILTSLKALDYAQELGHPYSLVYALSWDILLQIHIGLISQAEDRVEDLIALCREHPIRHFLLESMVFQGWLRSEQGEIETGTALIRDGMERFQSSGSKFKRPYFLSLLAEQLGRWGEIQQGLVLLHEACGLMEKSEERWCEAEILRRQGELLMLQSDLLGAERVLQQALLVAHKQKAKMLELRAAVALGRLWQRQGKDCQARGLVTPLYQWFREGLDTPDLRNARLLLVKNDHKSDN